MNDEDNTDPQARHPSNNSNVDTAVQIQYLRSKVGTLERIFTSFKVTFGGRVAHLEKENSELRRKLIFVKGFIYGLLAAAGTGIWAIFDKLKKLGVDLFQ